MIAVFPDLFNLSHSYSMGTRMERNQCIHVMCPQESRSCTAFPHSVSSGSRKSAALRCSDSDRASVLLPLAGNPKNPIRRHDITDEDTPLEAGLGFAIKFDKPGGFIGRDALLKQKYEGTTRQLVQFSLEDPEPLLYHNEPIWRGDEIVGHITSGAYGHTLGSCIGLGYVNGAVTGEKFEIEVAGKRYKAEASVRPLYDPDNARIRC